MAPAAVISKLSSKQRRTLISHIEGPQPLKLGGAGDHANIDSLFRAGFIRGYPIGAQRPRFTDLTDLGRKAVARILSEYAEALIAAGCLEIDPTMPSEARPLKMLSRIKTRRSHVRGIAQIAKVGENNPHEAVDNP